jgi:hypothetical protein
MPGAQGDHSMRVIVAGRSWVRASPLLAPGLPFVCTEVSRLAHFFVVMTAGTHEARAAAWTVGSPIVHAMVVMVIVHSVTRLLASS